MYQAYDLYNKPYGKPTKTWEEMEAYLRRCRRGLDVLKDGVLFATSDSSCIRIIQKKRPQITGSVGWKQFMAER